MMHLRLGGLVLGLLAVLIFSTPEAAENNAEPKGTVEVGRNRLFVIHEGFGIETAVDRANRANQQIESALSDPDCDPEEWEVRQTTETPVIQVCNYSVLLVTEADAAREGIDVNALGERWRTRLQEAFAREKQAAFSARLLHRAILGLVLPLSYLALILLVRLLSRRIRARLHVGTSDADAGVRSGFSRLVSSVVELKILGQLVAVLTWAAYIFLTYVFVVVLFEQFPRTARWSGEMFEPLADLSAKLGQWTFTLILPRLILLLIVLVVGRLLLEAIGRLFEQVKAGRLRFEPILSPDTAGPAELTARLLVIATGLFLVGVLAPGGVGNILLGVLGLALFALSLGAWDLTSNMLAGMVNLYGRPFRTGQRIRTAHFEGVVQSKGLLLVRLETEEGRTILLPNRWLLKEPVQIVKRERRLYMEVSVQSPGGPEAACGLFRHASHAAGLKREEGEMFLVEVCEGVLLFHLEWPVPKGETPSDYRYKFIEALLARAAGLGIQVVSARPRTQRES